MEEVHVGFVLEVFFLLSRTLKEIQRDGVGVMKDKDLKFEDVKDTPHTGLIIIHTTCH